MAPNRLASKETNDSLRLAQARLALALSSSQQLVWHQDAELRYTWIARASLGFTEEAVIGRSDEELLGSENALALVAIKRRAMAMREVQREEVWLKHGGEPACFDLTVIPEVDSSATVSGVICTAIDITQRKKAERELRTTKEQLELALFGADLGMWHLDISTGELQLNRRSVDMLGYRIEDVPPALDELQRLVHPDDLPRVMQLRTAHFEGETAAYQAEYRLRHRDGHWVWILSRGKVVARDTEGKPLRAAGTHLDITDRKQMQLEGPELLHRIEALIRGLSEPLRDGIAATDKAPAVKLTARQQQVLGMIAAGMTSGKIANALHISVDTVIGHRRELMSRLNLHSVAELTRYAVEHGISPPPSTHLNEPVKRP